MKTKNITDEEIYFKFSEKMKHAFSLFLSKKKKEDLKEAIEELRTIMNDRYELEFDIK